MVDQDLGAISDRQQAYTMDMVNVLSQLQLRGMCSCQLQLVPLAAPARFSLQESL